MSGAGLTGLWVWLLPPLRLCRHMTYCRPVGGADRPPYCVPHPRTGFLCHLDEVCWSENAETSAFFQPSVVAALVSSSILSLFLFVGCNFIYSFQSLSSLLSLRVSWFLYFVLVNKSVRGEWSDTVMQMEGQTRTKVDEVALLCGGRVWTYVAEVVPE